MRASVAGVFVYRGPDGFEILVEGDGLPMYHLTENRNGHSLALEMLRDYFGTDDYWLVFKQIGADDNMTGNGVIVFYLCILPEKINPYVNVAEWVPLDSLGDSQVIDVINIGLRGIGLGT
jgi:hypothetical protein